MPSYTAPKLPSLPASVVNAPKVAQTKKSFPVGYQEVKPNLVDSTAKFIQLPRDTRGRFTGKKGR